MLIMIKNDTNLACEPFKVIGQKDKWHVFFFRTVACSIWLGAVA